MFPREKQKVWRYQKGNRKSNIEGQTIQWLKEKGQTIFYKALDRKKKTEEHEPPEKPRMTSGAPEG